MVLKGEINLLIEHFSIGRPISKVNPIWNGAVVHVPFKLRSDFLMMHGNI